MESKKYKEFLNLFFLKLAEIFNKFFPGIVVLDLFFNYGYFSKTPDNIYSFILFLVWSAILSVPFNFIHPPSIRKWSQKISEKMANKNGMEIKIFKSQLDSSIKESIKDVQELFTHGYILIQLLFTYLVYKILVSLNIPNESFFEIPVAVAQLIITIIIVTLLGFPIGFVYKKIWNSIVFKEFGLK